MAKIIRKIESIRAGRFPARKGVSIRKQNRLIYMIGWIHSFFSLNPSFVLCDHCSMREGILYSARESDGTGRISAEIMLCKKCYDGTER